jgi:hypothetical protein
MGGGSELAYESLPARLTFLSRCETSASSNGDGVDGGSPLIPVVNLGYQLENSGAYPVSTYACVRARALCVCVWGGGWRMWFYAWRNKIPW